MDDIEEMAKAGFAHQNPGADWHTAQIIVRQSWVKTARAVKDIAKQMRRMRGSLHADLGESANAGFFNSHERWENAGERERVLWRQTGEAMRDKWEELGAME